MDITYDDLIADGFDSEESFKNAVGDFMVALESHKLTVGEPAPVANKLVEKVAKSGGVFSIPDKLNGYKKYCISANQKNAGVLISALYGGKTGDKLDTAQRNDLMTAAIINRKEAKSTATSEEIALLDAMESKALMIAAIRAAENAAAELINQALDVAGVDAVKDPVWPA